MLFNDDGIMEFSLVKLIHTSSCYVMLVLTNKYIILKNIMILLLNVYQPIVAYTYAQHIL